MLRAKLSFLLPGWQISTGLGGGNGPEHAITTVQCKKSRFLHRNKNSLFGFSAFNLYTITMKIVFLLLVVAAIIYLIFRLLASLLAALSGKPASPTTPVVLQPTRPELDISIADQGKDGMPVITIRSHGATLNIRSVKQDASRYAVSAEKQMDNVAVIFVEEKQSGREGNTGTP